MLTPEASMPEAPPFGRGFVASRLGLSAADAAGATPLLYSLVAKAGAAAPSPPSPEREGTRRFHPRWPPQARSRRRTSPSDLFSTGVRE